jgi:hypothetical protein
MVYFHPSIYYVRYSMLFRLYRLVLLSKPFNLRLLLVSLIVTVLLAVQQTINLFFRLLDEIFFFKYRQIKIEAPVYIIANPRSGTTYLHRLLSLDEERYAYMKFWHTLFPSVSFIKLIHAISGIDKKLGSHLKRLLDRIDAKMFRGWEEIHPMGFSKPEEDEAPFGVSMTSPTVCLLFPYLHFLKKQWLLDNDDEKVKTHVMQYYTNCLQRFMYAAGQNKTYLSKNVFMSGRIATLLKYFPDARVIYIVRHPYKVLPSFVSMYAVMYRAYCKHMKDTDDAMKAWAELGIEYYLHFNKIRHNLSEANLVTLKYDSFVASPVETVKSIYGQFQWMVTSPFEKRLFQEVNANKEFKSTHTYSLEQYGLSKEEIGGKLNSVFEEFGFDKSEVDPIDWTGGRDS